VLLRNGTRLPTYEDLFDRQRVHWRFGLNLESPGFQRVRKYVKDTILTVALLFAQFFGASSDSLEHFFHLPLLRGRDILKCTFDESGVLAEDRNEYSASPSAVYNLSGYANRRCECNLLDLFAYYGLPS
jgi:hypothetical protein